MPKPKDEEIWDELKRRAREIRFGVMVIEFRIHEEKITGAEMRPETRIKLG